jgi:glycosyltransferase involved in cell wall biosynthesis
MRPRISVVIPTYNSGPWVEATLESVVRQTYPLEQLEVIVVDDASKDDSVAVSRRFLERQTLRHRVIAQEKNRGAAAARNAGWRVAEGEWIQFLDSDDLLAPHKIELQASRVAQAQADVAVVYSNWQAFTLEDGVWQPSGPLNAPFVDDDPILQILEQFDFGYVGPTLIRRSALEQISGFVERPNIGEDCELMLRLAMAGVGFREARSETAAFFYRHTPNSVWRRHIKDVEVLRNLLDGYRKVEAFMRERAGANGLSQRARAAIALRYSRFAELYYENDLDSFRLLVGGLRGLGYDYPLNVTGRIRLLAKVIGYENTLRVRSAYRARAEWLRRLARGREARE